MDTVEWTSDAIIDLIKEYKKRRELWDKNNDLYRVQSAKYQAWSSLAKLFGCDIVDLRKKFNSLLASRRRELAKIRGGGRSNWYLYSHLNFLSGHLDTQESDDFSKSYQDADPMSDEQDDGEDDAEPEISIKTEPTAEAFPPKKTPYRNCRRLIRTVKRRVKEPQTTQIDGKLIEMLKLLRKSEISKKKDECDSFGEYIATSLRKHDERTQSMIKQAINNILFEQEMKKYNNAGQYTVIIGDPDENPLASVHE